MDQILDILDTFHPAPLLFDYTTVLSSIGIAQRCLSFLYLSITIHQHFQVLYAPDHDTSRVYNFSSGHTPIINVPSLVKCLTWEADGPDITSPRMLLGPRPRTFISAVQGLLFLEERHFTGALYVPRSI